MTQTLQADVTIIGAGTSGALSAIACARQGLKTLVVEKTGTVGGVGITTLMGSFAYLMVGHQKQFFIAGLVKELVERIVSMQGTPYQSTHEAIFGKIDEPFSIPFQPIAYTLALTDMIAQSGAQLFLNTVLVTANENQDSTKTLLLCHDTQQIKIDTKIVIDASGNALAAAMLGADTQQVPSTYGCLMKLSNADIQKTLSYVCKVKPWKQDDSYSLWLKEALSASGWQKCKHLLDPLQYDHAPMISKQDILLSERRFNYLLRRYEQEGVIYTMELSLLRYKIKEAAQNGDFLLHKINSDGTGVTFNGDGIAAGGWGKGVVLCNVAKPYGYDPADATQETIATSEARSYNYMFYLFAKKYLPGFEECNLQEMGAQAIARAGRIIIGCDDSIMLEQNELYRQPIYLFGGLSPFRTGEPVPYGKIVSRNIPNLFTIGKSSSHGMQYRSQISCMSMGIAAAAAAATVISSGYDSHNIPTASFVEFLNKLGVIL